MVTKTQNNLNAGRGIYWLFSRVIIAPCPAFFILEKQEMRTCTKCATELPEEAFHFKASRCKRCRNTQEKERYLRKRDQIVERVRTYREENREKIMETRKEKYKTDLEFKARCRELAAKRRAITENRIKANQYAEKYRNENRGLVNHRISLAEYKNRAKAHGQDHVCDLTYAQWIEILNKFNHCCARCGTTEDITKDHIIPISAGGNTTKENIQPLCNKCNTIKQRIFEKESHASKSASSEISKNN